MNCSPTFSKLLLLPCLALLVACGTEDDIPETLVRNLQSLSGSEHLLCRYQKTRPVGQETKPSLWYFWRQKDRTETYDEYSKQGEIWTRDPSGSVFYHRIFYGQKATLEYNPGDLAAAGVKISWDHLFSIVDPGLLGDTLKRSEAKPAAGSERYQNTLADGAKEEVVWLPALRLPFRVTRTRDTALQDDLRLIDCVDSPSASFRPVPDRDLAEFRAFEFADLGDMESDPVVQRLASLLGGHHH